MSGLTAGTDSASIFFAEALGTLVLSLGVAAVVYGKRSGHEAGMYVGGALFIGLVIAALSQGAGVLNPALMVGLKSVGWAFILGPIVGAVVGLNLYKMLVGDDEKINIVKKAKKAVKKA
jgi:glycerol uptake facilitator-like aquaporin